MTEFLLEILGQPEAIRATAAYYEEPRGAEALDRFIAAAKSARRIIATGMGSSNFLSGALATMLGANGVEVTAVNAGELLHYSLPTVKDGTLLIAVSQSGESFETVNIVKQLEARGVDFTLAAITNEAESFLGRRASILLPTLAGREEKTSSKTFITAYQVIYMIARRLEGAGAGKALWEQIATSIDATLNRRDTSLPALLRTLGEATYLQFIARGTAMASASQSALMAMESSHTAAQAMPGGEFRHGPLEMVQPGFVAVILAHTADPTFDRFVKLAQDILRFGGRVMLVTDRADAMTAAEGLTIVGVDAPADPRLFAIPAIIPVQIAIEAWAREAKGIIPGEFTHGAKVTAIE